LSAASRCRSDGAAFSCSFAFYGEAVLQAVKDDQVLPFFFVQELPVGLAGLMIAAVLGCTMSVFSAVRVCRSVGGCRNRARSPGWAATPARGSCIGVHTWLRSPWALPLPPTWRLMLRA
jgi:hypothetical protein